MTITERIKLISDFVKKGRLAFKRHTALRMHQRKISAIEIEEAIISGEIIEDYSEIQPLPSYLILGYTDIKRPIHIVAGIDYEEGMVWAISAYEPNLLQWEKGYKKRRGR